MYVIYALIDPRDNTVHYVGQTTDVYTRFQQHIRCESSSFTKNAWIMELRAENKMVIMETLEEVGTYQKAIEREAYWIQHFEMLREPLSNVTHRASLKKIKKDQMRVAKYAATQVLTAIKTSHATETTRRTEEERAELVRRAEEERKELARQVMEERKEKILSSMESLKNEGRLLTPNAIATRAGLTHHQYKEIEEVAAHYGHELVRGKGRPAEK